jgi:GMP synthase-like glutamine amidotransferase
MKIHWLQHASTEHLGRIEPWLLARGHTLAGTSLHTGETLPPNPDGYDWLIVMGGPMNVYQYRDHPWLLPEGKLIRETISAGKRVLGICLGAQLIADVLGAKVFQNPYREIGWFTVHAVPAGAASPFALPPETLVMNWHGDTFSLPSGSTWLAESEGCAHQAFAIGRRILGLQFHLETSPEDMQGIEESGAAECAPDRYIQTVDTMIARAKTAGPAAAELLDRMLTVLEQG